MGVCTAYALITKLPVGLSHRYAWHCIMANTVCSELVGGWWVVVGGFFGWLYPSVVWGIPLSQVVSLSIGLYSHPVLNA